LSFDSQARNVCNAFFCFRGTEKTPVWFVNRDVLDNWFRPTTVKFQWLLYFSRLQRMFGGLFWLLRLNTLTYLLTQHPYILCNCRAKILGNIFACRVVNVYGTVCHAANVTEFESLSRFGRSVHKTDLTAFLTVK